MNEFPDIQWTEISFSDDEGFQWEEVLFDIEDTAIDPLYFNDDSWFIETDYSEIYEQEVNPIDSYYDPSSLRGPFLSDADAKNYASEIHGAYTEVIYDEDIDGYWLFVGESG